MSKVVSISSVHRAPPQNIEAERALIATILFNNRTFDQVSDFLLPQHFADPVCALLYETAIKVIGKGVQLTLVTAKTYLEGNSLFNDAGGIKYLTALAGTLVNTINAKDYGKVIRDCFLRRELIGIGENIVNNANDGDADRDAQSQIESAEQELFNLSETGTHESGPIPFSQAMTKAIELSRRAYEKPGDVSGLTTGLTDLDQQIGGLHPSDLVVLAARPGMGKTALATHIASAASAHGSVIFFSLEMGAEQLAQRVLSKISGVDSHKIRTGKMSGADFDQVVAALVKANDSKLIIDDTPSLTVPAIRTRARRIARKGGLALIVIDYIQLIECPSLDGNRVQEITKITRGLKAIAKELGVPVIALSQLNRGVENREDKRPRLADLRDSGSIEQDADVAMFLYREEYYQRDACDPSLIGVAEIDVAKQRHGPIGVVNVYFDAVHASFSDLSRVTP